MYSMKKQAFLLFIGKFSVTIINFLVPVILVRVLTQQEYGTYRQSILLFTFFVPLLQMGINESLYYFYNKEDNKELISQSIYLFSIIGLIFLILFLLFHGKIPLLFKGLNNLLIVRNTGIYIGIYFISICFETLLILEKKQMQLFLFVILDQLLRIIFVIIFALIYRNTEQILVGLIIYSTIKLIIFLIYVNKNYQFPQKLSSISMIDLINQIKYSLPLGSGRIIGDIGRKADKFILSYFLNAADFAVYAVGNFNIPIISIAYLSIGRTVLPQIAEYFRKDLIKEAYNLWHKVIVTYSLITIPIVFYCFGFAKEIIVLLFTEQYIDSVIIFRIFLLTFFGEMLSRGAILKASKNTKYALYANIASMLSGIILGFILIQLYGVIGGVVSAIISFNVNVIVQIYYSGVIINVSFSKVLPWKKIIELLIYSSISLAFVLLFKLIQFNYFIKITLSFFIFICLIGILYHFSGNINFRLFYRVFVDLSHFSQKRFRG